MRILTLAEMELVSGSGKKHRKSKTRSDASSSSNHCAAGSGSSGKCCSNGGSSSSNKTGNGCGGVGDGGVVGG